jgi:uncharacterized protein YciI
MDAGAVLLPHEGRVITFDASSVDEAERLVADDPFAREDLLERRWVKEWLIE